MNDDVYFKLKEYALGLLAQRSYTCAKLREKMTQKLRRTGGDETMIEPLITRFRELGYLNDLDYCRRFVAERSRMRPRGKRLLIQELRKKGIINEVIDQFWMENESTFNELGAARRVCKKKLQQLDGRDLDPRKKRERLYRHLASKGFNGSIILQVLED